jgi:peptide/nickel transport system ATP-binding protein
VSDTLVQVRDLSVEFGPEVRPIRAVSGVSLDLGRGEIVGIAGESGSGKSTLCSALIRALPPYARVRGSIEFDGKPLLTLSKAEMQKIRGSEIAMILQNPMTALDPLFTIGNQLREVLVERVGTARGEAGGRAVELLRNVHLTAPDVRIGQYPHQLSGGMKQRILTAMATAASPKMLLADEPTTALDVTIQEEILVLFREICRTHGTTIVIVTHDLEVLRRVADRVVIMYAGHVMEEGPTQDIFQNPRHPYTRGLIESIPRIDNGGQRLKSIPGQVPDLRSLGPGCAFSTRCGEAFAKCATQRPPAASSPQGRAFCWLYG